MSDLERYSFNKEKNRNEEIVLLKGNGCFWKKCSFCDYYLDRANSKEAIEINQTVLSKITGRSSRLTVINSGSFFELPKETIESIKEIVINKEITDLSIEAHLKYIDKVIELKDEYRKLGISVHPRIGIETFDESIREDLFKKGFGKLDLDKVKQVFDECCLLYGVKGQNKETLLEDIKIATSNFKDVYLNIYEQRTGLPSDPELIKEFIGELYPELNKIQNLHILINNTDLGVG